MELADEEVKAKKRGMERKEKGERRTKARVEPQDVSVSRDSSSGGRCEKE